MNTTVTLRHERLKGNRIVPFYDGLLVAKDGLLTIPADKPLWIQRAFRTGWNTTPSGQRLWGLRQLDQEIKRQLSETPEQTAESAGETIESVPQTTDTEPVTKTRKPRAKSTT